MKLWLLLSVIFSNITLCMNRGDEPKLIRTQRTLQNLAESYCLQKEGNSYRTCTPKEIQQYIKELQKHVPIDPNAPVPVYGDLGCLQDNHPRSVSNVASLVQKEEIDPALFLPKYQLITMSWVSSLKSLNQK